MQILLGKCLAHMGFMNLRSDSVKGEVQLQVLSDGLRLIFCQ